MNTPTYFFVFDVESIGLHGEGYAVGYVVTGADGEVESGRFACPPDNAEGDGRDREWVMENVPPIEVTHCTPNDVREAFWRRWMEWKEKGAVMVSDCGWPVEARFLIACIEWDVDARKWQGAYPLHDLASVMLANRLDPLETRERLPDELPTHDPLCDARQSARLLTSLVGRAAGVGVRAKSSAPQRKKYNVQDHPLSPRQPRSDTKP